MLPKIRQVISKHFAFVIFGSILHGIFLLAVTLYLQNHSLNYLDNSEIVLQTAAVFSTINKEGQTYEKEFAFINTAYDMVFIPYYDELTGSGKLPITDRKKLLELFKKLNDQKSNIKYVILDIFLNNKSEHDEKLAKQLLQFEKVTIPYILSNQNETIFPVAEYSGVNLALGTYRSKNDYFYKYLLYDKQNKSLALTLYEKLNGVSLHRGLMFDYINNKITTSQFIPDYKITNYDLFQRKQYKIINLGYLLNLPKPLFDSYIKDKIIIIGDFVNNDIHHTVVGDLPGPVVIANAYLGMLNNENIVSYSLLLLLFLSYLVISYTIFYIPKDGVKAGKIRKNIVFKKLVTYETMLFFIALIVFYMYGKIINIFLLLVWLPAFHWVLRKYYIRKTWLEKT